MPSPMSRLGKLAAHAFFFAALAANAIALAYALMLAVLVYIGLMFHEAPLWSPFASAAAIGISSVGIFYVSRGRRYWGAGDRGWMKCGWISAGCAVVGHGLVRLLSTLGL